MADSKTGIAYVEPYMISTKTLVELGRSLARGIFTVYFVKERDWKVVASCSGRNAEFVKSMDADESH